MTKKNDGFVARAIRWLYWRSDAYHGDPTYSKAVSDAYDHGQAEAVEIPALPPAEADVDLPPPEDMKKLSEALHETIRRYVFRGESDGYTHMLEALSVLHQMVGYVDGMACLSGVPRDYRLELRTMSEFHGKKRSLTAHDEMCEGCTLGTALHGEIFPPTN